MAQLQGRNDVQWQAVKEAAEEWDHEAEGLTQAATAVIMLAVTAATGGAGGLFGSGLFTGTGLLASAGISVTNSVAMAAINAGFTTIVSRATVSLINNKGDLGAVFAELGSSDFLKSLATSVITAGVVAGLDATVLSDAAWGIPSEAAQIKTGVILTKLDTFGEDLIRASIRGTVSAGITTGINGGDLGKNLALSLRDAAIDTLGATAAEQIGFAFKRNGGFENNLDWGLHKVAHGALGCAIGAAGGSDCASGAFGAVVGEVVAEGFANFLQTKALALARGEGLNPEQITLELLQWKRLGVDLAKLGAGLGALAVGLDVDTAARTGGNAAENNALFIGTIIFLATVAYTAYQGGLDGPLKGLEVIADGSDPISKALASGKKKFLDFSAENAPEATKLVLDALTAAGELAQTGFIFIDQKTGKTVSRKWNNLSTQEQKWILGGVKVVGFVGIATPVGVASRSLAQSGIKAGGDLFKASATTARNAAKSWAANPQTFTKQIDFTPSTGLTYKVFQRNDIDWNQVRTDGAKDYIGKTNAEAAKNGYRPQLRDGNFATIHHSQQNAKGPWFEASTKYHNISTAQRAPLHPYGRSQHPHNPLGKGSGSLRNQFQKTESPEYWIHREANR